MDDLRMCIIGIGRAGMVHANNIVHNLKNASLVAIVDSNIEVAKQKKKELGIEKVFSNIDEALEWGKFDAVVIVTPTFTHKDVAIKVSNEGKHIFCEKPISIKIDDAKEMISFAEKNNVLLQVGFMRRFDPPYRHAKEIIEDGKLGEVMIIKSVGRGPGLPPPWTYKVKDSNGLLGEVNSHDFDSTRWLAGSEYKRIYAEGTNKKVKELREKYLDFYDNVVCTVRFKNDVLGTIDGTCPVDYGYDARTEIVLSKGLLVIGELKGEALVSCDIRGYIKEYAFRSWRNRFKDAYIDEMRSFVNCILNNKKPEVGGYDGLAAVKAVVAANKSIRENVPVELD